MSSLTARLGLYKPADNGAENINVTTDLNNNLDALDAKIGAFPCTSGNRPLVPFDGMMIRETDTGKVYIYNGNTASWQQMLFHTAGYDQDITLSSASSRFRVGSSSYAASFLSTRAVAGDVVLATMVSGDTVPRLAIGADGSMDIGAGGASAADISIYRDSPGVLGIGDNLLVEGDVIAGDTVYTSNIEVSGDLILGTGKFRPQLSSVGTVANTTTETILSSYEIPANDLVVGAVFRVKICGLASCTGTPTLTLRLRLGASGSGVQLGTSGAVAFSSGVSNRPFIADGMVAILTTGATGSARAAVTFDHLFGSATGMPTAPTRLIDSTTAGATVDTTAIRYLELTAQWSAANASNTVSAYVASIERVI